MALYRRGKTWWVDFTTPSGQRIRQTAGTDDKKAAQELHDKLKAETWRVDRLKEKPKRTWEEAALKWLKETDHKRTHQMDIRTVRWLHQHFQGLLLTDLTRERIAELAENKMQSSGRTSANRLLAVIRAILRRAALEWEWIDRAPHIRLYPEPKRRVRWLTQQQAQTLLQELPEHLADLVRFSLSTGLRKGNVLGLEWSQVDMPRRVAWIHGDQAKAGRDIHVTLNATAIEVLAGQVGKHPKYVFTYRGRPISQVNTKAWHKALKRAGIDNFRWHDLRHTWASWLAQGGVPLNVLQEMGGWESTIMVRRYAHLAPEQFGRHAQIVDVVLNGTTAAHEEERSAVLSA